MGMDFPIIKSAENPAPEALNPLDGMADFSTIARPHSPKAIRAL
jgi:hypothetical protein